MSQEHKDLIHQELEKIYDSKYRWIQAGNALRDRFNKSLNYYPLLKWILSLSIMANIGIWLTLIFLNLKLS